MTAPVRTEYPERGNGASDKERPTPPAVGNAPHTESPSKSLSGNSAGQRKLTADDVCAFCWDQVTEHMRAALCALVSLPQSLALLEWYEIGPEYRALLRHGIADLIEHNASRQRAEWAQAGRVAA